MLIPVLVLVVIAVAVWANLNKHRRRCRWRQSRAESRGALVKYSCVTCGAEAFRTKGAPKECLAPLDKPRL